MSEQFFPFVNVEHKSKTVYCELALASQEDQKLIYFTLYQNQKSKQVIHKFILDHGNDCWLRRRVNSRDDRVIVECSFVRSDKRDFSFKHGSATESVRPYQVWSSIELELLSFKFITESGSADHWIAAFNEAIAESNHFSESVFSPEPCRNCSRDH